MKNNTKTAAIILAAGKGTRMQSRTPKQYLTLENKPVLFYSLETFSKLDIIDEIILVVSEGEIEYCREQIIELYGIEKVKAVTEGGTERYLSVWNGIKHVSTDVEYVMIHELCHLIEFNHGKRFKKLMDEFCPNWKKIKKVLNE